MRPVHFTSQWRLDGPEAGRLDGARVDGKGSLLEGLAGALGLPNWFGHNWDALDEALREFDVPDAGLAVVIENATVLWREHPKTSGTLVEVWLDSAPDGLYLVFSW